MGERTWNLGLPGLTVHLGRKIMQKDTQPKANKGVEGQLRAGPAQKFRRAGIRVECEGQGGMR